MTIAFIHTLNHEIARLQAVIEAAKGAEAQLIVLRGAVEMLEDVEKTALGQGPKAQVPPVPLIPRRDDSKNIHPVSKEAAKIFDEVYDRLGGDKAYEEAFAQKDAPEQPGTAPSDHQGAQPAADMPIATKEPEAVIKSADGTVAGPKTVETKLVDAATLVEPLTRRQLQVFNALWKLHNAGEPTTVKMLTTEVGFHVHDAVDALVKKRYIKRDQNSYPYSFYPVATGTPRVGVTPEQPAKINGDAARGSLDSDPGPGRSALDKKRAIDELGPVAYLIGKGHVCRRITADTYQLDSKTVSLKTILEQINIYRCRAKLPSLDLTRYL